MGWLKITADQQFSLPHSLTLAKAVAFVQEPLQSLDKVDFLQNLQLTEAQLTGELLVRMPVLGEVDLPFSSQLVPLVQGAELQALTLSGQRAWVAVSGQAQAEAKQLHFSFQFVAHLQAPNTSDWGTNAFEKMVKAAAQRTLQRVATTLPRHIAVALDELS